MPTKTKKPCKHRGCPLLTDKDYCDFHVRLHKDDRLSESKRGHDNRWRKESK